MIPMEPLISTHAGINIVKKISIYLPAEEWTQFAVLQLWSQEAMMLLPQHLLVEWSPHQTDPLNKFVECLYACTELAGSLKPMLMRKKTFLFMCDKILIVIHTGLLATVWGIFGLWNPTFYGVEEEFSQDNKEHLKLVFRVALQTSNYHRILAPNHLTMLSPYNNIVGMFITRKLTTVEIILPFPRGNTAQSLLT